MNKGQLKQNMQQAFKTCASEEGMQIFENSMNENFINDNLIIDKLLGRSVPMFENQKTQYYLADFPDYSLAVD